MVGLICSRIPDHIWMGIVRCSGPAMNSTTTTSSNEVMKANKAPETTPGVTSGSTTLKKARTGEAPRLAAARVKVWSNPVRVAVTVMTTKGIPSAVCASTTPT